MAAYNEIIIKELQHWQKKMIARPSFGNYLAKGLQTRANSLIPERIHSVITSAIKNMVKAVLTGSQYTTPKPVTNISLWEREQRIKAKLYFYKRTASIEGAGTGAGGIILGMADFPLLLSLKMKFLYDTAALYGYDVKDIKERLYILYIFQLAFSSQEHRIQIYRQIINWDEKMREQSPDMDNFDWRSFQQEYRDYMDLAKLIQLLPGIGAVAGAYANYKLLNELGETAMNAYRMRLHETDQII